MKEEQQVHLTFVVGLLVAIVILVVGIAVFHLGGDPGLPQCPKTATVTRTFACK